MSAHPLVLPEQDAVLAITSCVDNMQAVLDLVWEHLLPAMAPERLPTDGPGLAELERKLSSLALLPPEGLSATSCAFEVSGRRYALGENPLEFQALSLAFPEDACVATLRDPHGERKIVCGYGRWVEQEVRGPGGMERIAAGAAWADVSTLHLAIRWVETPYSYNVAARFDGDRVQMQVSGYVGFQKQSFTLQGCTQSSITANEAAAAPDGGRSGL